MRRTLQGLTRLQCMNDGEVRQRYRYSVNDLALRGGGDDRDISRLGNPATTPKDRLYTARIASGTVCLPNEGALQ